MNINILRYSFFGIAEGQEIDHTFVKNTDCILEIYKFNVNFFNDLYLP